VGQTWWNFSGGSGTGSGIDGGPTLGSTRELLMSRAGALGTASAILAANQWAQSGRFLSFFSSFLSFRAMQRDRAGVNRGGCMELHYCTHALSL
jgi:hypothetical protein